MGDWLTVSPAHCAHIAAFYHLRWEGHKCIAWQCLRRGYHQWASGRIEPLNNLFDAAIAAQEPSYDPQ